MVGENSDLDIFIYDKSNQEAFLGHAKASPNVGQDRAKTEGWFKLEARDPEADHVSGEIHISCLFQRTEKKQYGPGDFQLLKLIGKG